MYVSNLREAVSTASAVGACGFTAWRGGRPERLAAGVLLVAWLASPLLVSHAWMRAQAGVVGVDLALAAALGAIALGSDRWWPLPATAVAVLLLVDHLAFLTPAGVTPWAYFVAEEIWSYLLLVVLASGAALEAPPRRRALIAAMSAGCGPAPPPPGRANP